MFAFSDKNKFQGRGEEISSNFSIFPTIQYFPTPFILDMVIGEALLGTLATHRGMRAAGGGPVSPQQWWAWLAIHGGPQRLGPAVAPPMYYSSHPSYTLHCAGPPTHAVDNRDPHPSYMYLPIPESKQLALHHPAQA